ncbi:MAG: hypothetical protein IJ071_11140 [Ruminococcus sp.]|nr:hypothetical protein [Ruminococcus sp.]
MKDKIKQLIADSISTWTDTDIYAVSLYVYDDNDDPCKPTVTLGYNTESQVRSELDKGFASDEEEARWNFAFWLHNDFFVFGEGETAETVKDWIKNSGLPYFEEGELSLEEAFERASEVTKAFVSVLIEVVKELHQEKVLTRKFGKELPILIHELEYYDEIAEQNIKANGRELVEDFAEWCLCC